MIADWLLQDSADWAKELFVLMLALMEYLDPMERKSPNGTSPGSTRGSLTVNAEASSSLIVGICCEEKRS